MDFLHFAVVVFLSHHAVPLASSQDGGGGDGSSGGGESDGGGGGDGDGGGRGEADGGGRGEADGGGRGEADGGGRDEADGGGRGEADGGGRGAGNGEGDGGGEALGGDGSAAQVRLVHTQLLSYMQPLPLQLLSHSSSSCSAHSSSASAKVVREKLLWPYLPEMQPAALLLPTKRRHVPSASQHWAAMEVLPISVADSSDTHAPSVGSVLLPRITQTPLLGKLLSD